MDSMSFTKFAKDARDSCPLLSADQITECLNDPEHKPKLVLYMYRIAALIAGEIKQSGQFRDADDSDYIDAAQQCVIDFPALITIAPDQFSGYCAVTFRRCIRRYLTGVGNGGTGTDRSNAARAVPLTSKVYGDAGYDADDEETVDEGYGEGSYDEPPIGFGDPLDELIRLETAEAALRTLERPLVGTNGGAKRAANLARAKRVEKELGNSQ